MRGKGCYMQELSGETGITPAYAGKRQRRATACTWLRDHPRVCGEKDAICKSCPARQGSPSRMRGKAGWPLCGLPCIGITPAYAGKSPPPNGPKSRTSTSPPRMRGKASRGGLILKDDGITPAYAGKSFCIPSRLLPDRDHPRVCGEKFNSGSMLKQMGDHPRVCGEKQCFE